MKEEHVNETGKEINSIKRQIFRERVWVSGNYVGEWGTCALLHRNPPLLLLSCNQLSRAVRLVANNPVPAGGCVASRDCRPQRRTSPDSIPRRNHRNFRENTDPYDCIMGFRGPHSGAVAHTHRPQIINESLQSGLPFSRSRGAG